MIRFTCGSEDSQTQKCTRKNQIHKISMRSVHSLCVHGTKRQTCPTSSNSLIRLSNDARKTTYQTSRTTVRQVGMATSPIPTTPMRAHSATPVHRSLNSHRQHIAFRAVSMLVAAIVDGRSQSEMLTRLNQHTMADQSHRLLHNDWVSCTRIPVRRRSDCNRNQKCHYVLAHTV